MEEEKKDKKYNGVYSHKLRAGKKRTYFFDVRTTRYDDYFITITESKRKFDNGGYESHKIFLYKEDFNKFMKGLTEAVNHVKTELMPDFDFEAFDQSYQEKSGGEREMKDQPNRGHHKPSNKPKPRLNKEISYELPPQDKNKPTESLVSDVKQEFKAEDEDAMSWD